jgi:hypothetical protein
VVLKPQFPTFTYVITADSFVEVSDMDDRCRNPAIRQSGNLLQLLAMLLISQQGSIKLPSVRKSSPKEPATNFRILYIRGNLNSWGPQHLVVCSGLIYATGGNNIKVKQSRNRPGVAQRVPGLASQISLHSAHEGGEVECLTHRSPLPPGNVPGTHFR